MRSKTLRAAIILLTLFSLAFNLVSAPHTPDPPPTPPTISFVGVESVTGGTKFTYHVKEGSDQLNYWELYSNAFLVYDVIDSSETCHSWNNKNFIKFTDPYSAGEERDVWFVLNIDYTGLVLDNIDYLLKSESEDYVGKILGPSVPDFIIPETSWGTLGAIFPMILVVFGLVLLRTRAVKLISFK
jgi:hypothetical protein